MMKSIAGRYGMKEKSLRSVEVVETSTAPGINGTSFKIKLNEKIGYLHLKY